ncbi:MAG TPA: sodium:solute symporter [Opitutaceae bacterium]
MNAADYLVLVGILLGIALYATWNTRRQDSLRSYLKGSENTHWFTIGLSVMATQASAITFLSTPGQGYQDGLGFVQNYFGMPLALIVVAAFFLPIFRKLNVYTAYEFLGSRFDSKTRLLAAGFFLLQRGLGAGLTIYAPAIVLSSVMGWRLDATIVCSGLVVVLYTVSGGCEAVNLTQKYQVGVIFAGMAAAFVIVIRSLPAGLTLSDSLAVAGGFHRLGGVDFSPDPARRYTFWSGTLGGFFLALAYFGTDQSQVQRYLSGGSLRGSRLGLMFNAVFKVPMQFFILLLGVFLFVFYQFERPPLFFNRAQWQQGVAHDSSGQLRALEAGFDSIEDRKAAEVKAWLAARRAGDAAGAEAARSAAEKSQAAAEEIHARAFKALSSRRPGVSANENDYVFVDFILDHLPHGLIGLLVAAFFAAALSSKAGELNALGSTTTVDLYRHIVRRGADDSHYVTASRWFTAFWGLVAIGFALFAHLAENLIQATNILGSVLYGAPLGVFLVAFFIRRIRGTAVFWGALGAQALVFVLYFRGLPVSYLWYNVIGAAACVGLSGAIQAVRGGEAAAA